MTFRIECPKCHWGYEFKDSFINKGFLKGKCQHCENEFFFKITVTGVNVEVTQELPEDTPCRRVSTLSDDYRPCQILQRDIDRDNKGANAPSINDPHF